MSVGVGLSVRRLRTNRKSVGYLLRIRNLQSYIFNQYLLHPELMPHMQNTTQDEIKKAMEELKAEVENEEKETVMDEYVEPIEEVNGWT